MTVRAQAQIRVELLRETKKAMARVLSPCGWAAEAALLQRQLLAAKQAMEVLLACATMPNDGTCWRAHTWSVRLQSTCMLTSGNRCDTDVEAKVKLMCGSIDTLTTDPDEGVALVQRRTGLVDKQPTPPADTDHATDEGSRATDTTSAQPGAIQPNEPQQPQSQSRQASTGAEPHAPSATGTHRGVSSASTSPAVQVVSTDLVAEHHPPEPEVDATATSEPTLPVDSSGPGSEAKQSDSTGEHKVSADVSWQEREAEIAARLEVSE